MYILNLTDNDLPVLQGVEQAPEGLRTKCVEQYRDGNPAGVRAGFIRGSVQTYAVTQQALHQNETFVTYIKEERPWLIVLPRSEDGLAIAKEICHMQIGPEPGTSIPLLVPIEARNKQWLYVGSTSDMRMPVVFDMDQNGNIAGLNNFVHRTPPLYGAQITPKV